jgi:hypothetical protein
VFFQLIHHRDTENTEIAQREELKQGHYSQSCVAQIQASLKILAQGTGVERFEGDADLRIDRPKAQYL